MDDGEGSENDRDGCGRVWKWSGRVDRYLAHMATCHGDCGVRVNANDLDDDDLLSLNDGDGGVFDARGAHGARGGRYAGACSYSCSPLYVVSCAVTDHS